MGQHAGWRNPEREVRALIPYVLDGRIELPAAPAYAPESSVGVLAEVAYTAQARKSSRATPWFRVSGYTRGLWIRTAAFVLST